MKITSLLLALFAGAARAQTLCDQYGYYAASGYEVNNNMWGKSYGSGSQCTYINSISGGGVSWRTDWTWSGGDNNVKAYPNAGLQISNARLVSQINNIPTSVSWSYSNTNIRANVAYDLFTAADPNHSHSSGDYELMIWLGRLGNIYPIGSSVGTVSVGGYSWDLWVGYNGSMRVFSFIASNPVNGINTNIKQFFTYLANSQGFPANNQYLITLQFGTEPFTGGPTTLNVNQFSASIQ